MLWDTAGYVYPTSLADNRWSGLAPWNEFNVTLDIAPESQQPQNYHQSWKPQWLMKWFTDASEFYAPRIAAANQSGHAFSRYSLLIPWVSPALVFYTLLISCVLICGRDTFAKYLFRARNRQRTNNSRGVAEKALQSDVLTTDHSPLILLVAWSYAALYWCSLLLAPVMCGRYIFPLFISIPTLLCLPWITLHGIYPSSNTCQELDASEHETQDSEQTTQPASHSDE